MSGLFHVLIMQPHLHKPTDLEFHCSFGWNIHPFERLGVLGYPGGAAFDLENTEVSEFQAVIVAQFLNNVIQKRLNDSLDHYTLIAGLFRNLIN